MKAPVQIYSFAGGLLDPQLAGRQDIKSYYAGAAAATNLVPLPLGGMERRPGLAFVAELPEAANGVRLANFEFSIDQTYLIALSDLKAHIYTANDGVKRATKDTVFTGAQLDEVGWTQSLDTMILAHAEHATSRLMRQGSHTAWAFEDLPFTNIPQYDFGSGAEAIWSNARGWPRTVQFFQGRMYLGGSKSRPQTLWGSQSDDYFNFATTDKALDDESVAATLDGDRVNAIRGLFGTDDLLAFTTGGVFVAQTNGAVITPNNFLPLRQSHIQAATVRPANIDGEAVFVSLADTDSHSSLYAILYDQVRRGYYTQDLAVRVPFVMREPVDMAVRHGAKPKGADAAYLVNGVDGSVAVLTVNRTESINAWAEWKTGDANGPGRFHRVAVIANSPHFLVKRTLGGVDRWFIERLDPTFATDCAVKKTVETPQTVFSGFDHLEGASLRVLADGKLRANAVVQGGAITLDQPAKSVEAGLGFGWKLQPMPIEAQLSDGTLIGHRHRILLATVRLEDTSELWVDGRRQTFRRLNTMATDRPLPSFTGLHTVRNLGWNRGASTVTLEGFDPLPARVLSVTIEVAQ